MVLRPALGQSPAPITPRVRRGELVGYCIAEHTADKLKRPVRPIVVLGSLVGANILQSMPPEGCRSRKSPFSSVSLSGSALGFALRIVVFKVPLEATPFSSCQMASTQPPKMVWLGTINATHWRSSRSISCRISGFFQPDADIGEWKNGAA